MPEGHLEHVRLWCRDRHSGGFYEKSAARDPVNLTEGGHRVIRGGSWQQDDSWVRAARRQHDAEDSTDETIGFRCVLEIK